MCILGKNVHSRWGTIQFPVRMNHNGITDPYREGGCACTGNGYPHPEWGCASPGMHILLGNGDVPHWECTKFIQDDLDSCKLKMITVESLDPNVTNFLVYRTKCLVP